MLVQKTFERTTLCRTLDPKQEDFEDFFSGCDNEELKALIVTICEEPVSGLTREALVECIYKQYQDTLEYAWEN